MPRFRMESIFDEVELVKNILGVVEQVQVGHTEDYDHIGVAMSITGWVNPLIICLIKATLYQTFGVGDTVFRYLRDEAIERDISPGHVLGCLRSIAYGTQPDRYMD